MESSSRRRRRDRVDAQLDNSIHFHFYRLPPELLDSIYQYLSLNASITLILTCSKFYCSVILADVRQKMKSTKTAHFERMCMLEDDKAIKGYHCRGCLKRHSSASFSQDELGKRAGERYCLWTKKCMWLSTGPDWSFTDVRSFTMTAKAKQLLQSDPRATTVAIQFLSPIQKYQAFLRVYPTQESISKDQFIALCMKVNLPLCPHTRTSDPKMTELFPPELNKSQKCRHCKTKVTLETYQFGTFFGEWCAFKTCRTMGRLFSPLEPTWLAQAFASRDPNLKDNIHAARKWIDDFWKRPFKGLEELRYSEANNDLSFHPIVLPDTLSSRMARFGVQAFLVALQAIPEVYL